MRGARRVVLAALSLVALAALPVRGAGQELWIAGGGSVPLGGLADVTDSGPAGLVGGSVDLGADGLVAGAVGFYSRHGHRLEGDRSDVYGVGLLLGYRVASAHGIRLTAWAGLGGGVHARKSEAFAGLDASKRGVTGHGGIDLSRVVARRVRVLVKALYTRGLGALGSDAYPTEVVTIGAGVVLPLGR